jgi:hypothetical protein
LGRELAAWRRGRRTPRLLKSERKDDRAGSAGGKAVWSLALRALGAHAADTALDETCPHAPVDPAGIRLRDDERPQRAGGALEHRRVALERLHRDLKTERSERIADALEAGTSVSGLLQAGCGSEAASEILARFSERSFSGAGGNLPDQEADQLRQPPVGELDPVQLGRHAVHVCRTSGSRSAPPAATLRRHREESSLHEPIEATPRDVTVDAQRPRDLVRSKGIALAASVDENPAKLRIAGRCQAIERHSAKRYPPAGDVMEQRRIR